jgi:type IX secretion system PorP/SprF family membrane protein
MKTIIKLSVVIITIVNSTAIAQQDPMYSQYVFNGLIINPAYAGSHDVLSTTLLYRDQWVSIPGAPKTGTFSIDAPLKNQKVGLGLNVEFDKIGVTNFSGITGAYSYKIKFSHGALHFGVQAGVGFYNSNFTIVKYSDGGVSDEAFQNNYHDLMPTFGFGMYYYTNRFYAGFSIPQIAGHAIQKALYSNSESAHLDLANHYFITSGYLFDLSPDMKLKPSVLLKYVGGAPIEIDLNSTVWFYDILALGVSYRSLASLNFLCQIRLSNRLYLGYAYEYATNSLNHFSSGSHEIMLQYIFNFSHGKIVTPRFF